MKILFLCVRNAGRSQMAEAFARRYAPEGCEIFSAGSEPASEVHPQVVDAMKERGIDLSGKIPRGLETLPEGVFDLVVGMGCGDACPTTRAKQIVQWEIPDPDGKSLEETRRIRNRIDLKVRRLLAGLRNYRKKPLLTLLGGATFLACCLLLTTVSFLSSPATMVPEPERALALVSSRTLQLERAVAEAPSWKQRLIHFFDPGLGSDEELPQLLAWHRELARLIQAPVVLAHIGVLEGESGQTELLAQQTQRWLREAPNPIPSYAGLLQVAYLEAPAGLEQQAELRELLPLDWFRDRLEERFALKQGDASAAAALRQADRETSRRLFLRYWTLAWLDWITFLLCPLCLLLWVAVKPAGGWRAADASIPPCWPFPAGMAVLLQGVGLGIAAAFAFSLMPSSNNAYLLVTYVLWTFPVFWLYWIRLLRPNRLSLAQEVGLAVPLRNWGKLALITLLGLGADALGNWLMGMAGNFLELPNHWAESFDADLVFGSRGVLAAALAGIVIIGPFAEELVFRGMLYGTLRGKYRRGTAAVLSGICFSLVHGYGVLGFLSVFWSGLVFAWVYEESGSLWPAVLVHSAGNLLFSLNLLALLRWS